MNVTLESIEKARESLKNVAYKTGLVHNTSFSELSGNSVYLKTENLQKTGSFKVRGAFNKIAHLSEKDKKNGVIASSGKSCSSVAWLQHLWYQIYHSNAKHAPLLKSPTKITVPRCASW